MSTNSCSTIGSNLGKVNCQGRRETPNLILVGGKEFTSSEYADSDTLQAAVIAATKLSTGNANKLYAFPVINKVTNNTEADTTGALSLGPTVRLKKGRPSYTYVMQDLSQELYVKLLSFDNKTVPVFTMDDSSQLWGYRAGATANTLNTNVFKGETARISVSGNGFKDSESVETGQCVVNVSYISIDDFEKRAAFMELPDFASGDVEGLKDVELVEPAAHVSNVHSLVPYIKVSELAGDLDIGAEYGSALAALTWSAKTGATYATTLAITTVAYTAGKLVFTFDSTAYAALGSGAKIKLIPPTVDVLDAADITGIELSYIILTK